MVLIAELYWISIRKWFESRLYIIYSWWCNDNDINDDDDVDDDDVDDDDDDDDGDDVNDDDGDDVNDNDDDDRFNNFVNYKNMNVYADVI